MALSSKLVTGTSFATMPSPATTKAVSSAASAVKKVSTPAPAPVKVSTPVKNVVSTPATSKISNVSTPVKNSVVTSSPLSSYVTPYKPASGYYANTFTNEFPSASSPWNPIISTPWKPSYTAVPTKPPTWTIVPKTPTAPPSTPSTPKPPTSTSTPSAPRPPTYTPPSIPGVPGSPGVPSIPGGMPSTPSYPGMPSYPSAPAGGGEVPAGGAAQPDMSQLANMMAFLIPMPAQSQNVFIGGDNSQPLPFQADRSFKGRDPSISQRGPGNVLDVLRAGFWG